METSSTAHPHPGHAPTVDQSARLAALNTRRGSGIAAPGERDIQPQTERDALNARLVALADRRGLPPPPPPGPAGPNRVGPSPRRRHPAKGARAAALGLSLASTGALASLFAVTGHDANGEQATAASIVASSGSTTPRGPATTAPMSTPSVAPMTPSSTTPPTTAPPTTAATQTVVDGAVFQNKWGDVQVEATFAGDGTLIDVTTLRTPYRDGKSVRINDRAVPRLNTEALTSQSARVDTVSGATYTSNDYRRSLQSAIDAASAAGLTNIV